MQFKVDGILQLTAKLNALPFGHLKHSKKLNTKTKILISNVYGDFPLGIKKFFTPLVIASEATIEKWI